MTATEIKVKLLQKGITQKDLAHRWNKPQSTVSRIVNRTLQSRALETKLARIIGVKLSELRADANGKAA
jgi:ribosome-binding protein aMBF1 (putative translation factor)